MSARFAFFAGSVFAMTALAKPIVPSPPETPVLGELEPYLVKKIGEGTTKKDASLADFADDPEFKALVDKHGLLLFNGPMVGSVTDTSARIWVRTARSATVRAIAGRDIDLNEGIKSAEVKTGPEGDFTALLDLSGLQPNTSYFYDIVIDGQPEVGGKRPSFRTSPAKGQKAKFAVAFGGGTRHIPKNEPIWDVMRKRDPVAMLFLGDNLYIDKEEELNIHNLYYYRRHLRPEFRSFVSNVAQYAIWDDHDFGLNDCAGGPERFVPAWKFPVWKVFRRNWVNPYYGGGEKDPGCWFDFSIGDVDVIMTDGRYYRDFKKGKTMLGEVQKKWLLETLKASKGTFKVIASGTLWTEHADKGGADSWWGVKEEREEIFSLLEEHKIGGVILISADRHRCDVYKIERPNGYDLWEFENSKITNLHTHGPNKKAEFSYNKGNFFGLLDFDLEADDPTVIFRCITSEDKEVYSKTLKRSELE